MKDSDSDSDSDSRDQQENNAIGGLHLHPKSPNHLSFPAKLVSGAVAGVIGTSM